MPTLSKVMNGLNYMREALLAMGYQAAILAQPTPRLFLAVGTIYFIEYRDGKWVAGILENDSENILREDTNFLSALGEICRQAGL